MESRVGYPKPRGSLCGNPHSVGMGFTRVVLGALARSCYPERAHRLGTGSGVHFCVRGARHLCLGADLLARRVGGARDRRRDLGRHGVVALAASFRPGESGKHPTTGRACTRGKCRALVGARPAPCDLPRRDRISFPHGTGTLGRGPFLSQSPCALAWRGRAGGRESVARVGLGPVGCLLHALDSAA